MYTTKQVGYAYPTSDTAHRFGLGKEGCYFVLFLIYDPPTQFGGRRHRTNRERGFATLAEAFAYAEDQAEQYDYFSLRPDGSEPWEVTGNTRPLAQSRPLAAAQAAAEASITGPWGSGEDHDD